ncbi:MAG TPA: tetratricopeptide repeat protein [Gammaproteobacteria bacterium]
MNEMKSALLIAAITTSTLLSSGGATAQPAFHEPIDLMPAVTGDHSWPVTTDSAVAQAYFDQGLQLRYAYGVDHAARSFKEAQRADPDCAMCYWGEAYALGSFLNAGITVEKAPYAYAAIQRAAELVARNGTQMEKDLIEASIVRYPQNYTLDMRRDVDEAYAAAMRAVYEKYPDHLDIIAAYASAIFLLEPRRGTRDIHDPDVIRLHAVLQDGLTQDIRHPGLCHLYIHATESTTRPELAEPCAEYISAGIPGASHINHMPSHTWNEVGRWNDSVRANIVAWHTDLKASVGEGVPIYPQHNLHMMLFAASNDGQGAIAIQAGKDYTKVTDDQRYHALTLLRFGRFDEILELDNRPENEISRAMWDFAMGYAELRVGSRRRANRIAEDLLELAETTEETFRFHDGDLIVGTLANILVGEIARADGDLEGAIAAFGEAVRWEDQIPYDEPEALPFAARHWLGAVLLEAGRPAEAEEVYRFELDDHPHNVWALFGLKRALEAQGKADSAVDADFAASTARVDTWITESRF